MKKFIKKCFIFACDLLARIVALSLTAVFAVVYMTIILPIAGLLLTGIFLAVNSNNSEYSPNSIPRLLAYAGLATFGVNQVLEWSDMKQLYRLFLGALKSIMPEQPKYDNKVHIDTAEAPCNIIETANPRITPMFKQQSANDRLVTDRPTVTNPDNLKNASKQRNSSFSRCVIS